jgi:iron complex transport system substrate-binding protein
MGKSYTERNKFSGSGKCSRKKLLLLLILPLLGGGCRAKEPERHPSTTDTVGGITLTDFVGGRLSLRAPPSRVISLAPNITEMVFAIGAGSRLIGRTSSCNYPPEAVRIESIGDYQTLNYEKIVAMKPDLVLMTFAGNTDAGYRKLKELGIDVFALDAETLTGVINTIDTVGLLLGYREGAENLSRQLRTELDSIHQLASARPMIPTFIVIDKSPLMTVSRGFIDEELKVAGGENIAAGAVAAYPTFSREELLRRDPEVILYPTSSAEDLQALTKLYPEWSRLRAVRNHRVYALPPDLLFRPGPRIIEGIRLIYRALHENGQ